MEIEEIKSLKIEFKGDEADKFRTAIKKIYEECSSVGFTNSNLNSDERKLVKEISEKVNK